MALVLKDRVQETATANTTVSFTLNGATAGYQSFAAVGNTNTTYYGASDGINWEVGIGTYATTGNLLNRTTILSSSNAGSAVTFSGTVTVFVDYPSGKSVYQDSTGAVTGYTISGGTIDNTVIGGTTPAAGTFTTITGQTEVLKGTGSNLFLYSEQFDNAYWSKTGATVTANSTTAPDGNVTADSLIENTANSEHTINNNSSTTIVANTIYIVSCYVKANGRTKGTIKYVLNSFATQIGADFDLTAGTISSAYIALGSGATNLVSSISNVGNGWFRVSVGGILDSTSTTVRGQILLSNGTSTTYTGNGTSGFYIWGCQFEIGSTANTYVPTTTTAVYGTPTLSFSGVAGLGLQSDGSLYVSPAGTGAIQAQATTSSATGGNARGANAVDWQTLRNSASQVASASQATISGGTYNTASNTLAVVSGGAINTASGYGGTIGGGYQNIASGNFGGIFTGQSNTTAGWYNFVGGGFTNSGTANSAVTTQSATMNGTTAVTLAASNAAIKVGQYISGTSIASDTYVAAISGTSLTLSKNASGSSTSTLSFYTPHGVVVGGGNNQATGSYSFIGGGGDAGTAANRNVASGDWSFVGGGRGNTASAVGAFVGGGGLQTAFSTANQATGEASVVVGGLGNTATTTGASVLGGYQNNATGLMSSILGGRRGTTRSITGNIVLPACNIPIFDSAGTSQSAVLVLGRETTNATATVITSDAVAAGTTNQVILPNNSAYYFKIEIIAGVTGGGNTSGWELKGVIKRGANAAATAIVGTVTKTLIAQDAGASTWVVNATADTTNGGITVTVTGQASTTIRWVARCTTTEMTY